MDYWRKRFRAFSEETFHDPFLRLLLRDQSGLRVKVQRRPGFRMPHEFLHHFDVLAIPNQKRRVCVPEGIRKLALNLPLGS